MSVYLKPIVLIGVMTAALSVAACSKSDKSDSSASELEEIKQELAELKKVIAEKDEPLANEPQGTTAITKELSLDDIAFEKAKTDGRVRAYGEYVREFPNGVHVEQADNGAWGSAKRQNSVLAYSVYRRYFPDGKYYAISLLGTSKAQARKAETDLKQLGFRISDMPSASAATIDSAGKFIPASPFVTDPIKPTIEESIGSSASPSTQASTIIQLPSAINQRTVPQNTETKLPEVNISESKALQQQSTTKKPSIKQNPVMVSAEETNRRIKAYTRKTATSVCNELNAVFKKERKKKFSKNRRMTKILLSNADKCHNFHYNDKNEGYLTCEWIHDFREQAEIEFYTLLPEFKNCLAVGFENDRNMWMSNHQDVRLDINDKNIQVQMWIK